MKLVRIQSRQKSLRILWLASLAKSNIAVTSIFTEKKLELLCFERFQISPKSTVSRSFLFFHGKCNYLQTLLNSEQGFPISQIRLWDKIAWSDTIHFVKVFLTLNIWNAFFLDWIPNIWVFWKYLYPRRKELMLRMH